MTNIAQLLFAKCPNREQDGPKTRWTHFWRWAPFYMVIVATVLVMLDPLRHVLQDSNLWEDSSMYRPDCHEDTLKCLSVLGTFFTAVFTYLGYFLLMWGVLWGTDLHKKIGSAWTQIRAKQLEARARPMNA